jgi:hypothetical protein
LKKKRKRDAIDAYFFKKLGRKSDSICKGILLELMIILYCIPGQNGEPDVLDPDKELNGADTIDRLIGLMERSKLHPEKTIYGAPTSR